MRKNKRKSVDSAALTAAWNAAFEVAKIERLEDYEAEGWMWSVSFAEKAGITRTSALHRLERMHAAGKLEQKKIRVTYGGYARNIWIFRPKL
jgi:hypothetical protein